MGGVRSVVNTGVPVGPGTVLVPLVRSADPALQLHARTACSRHRTAETTTKRDPPWEPTEESSARAVTRVLIPLCSRLKRRVKHSELGRHVFLSGWIKSRVGNLCASTPKVAGGTGRGTFPPSASENTCRSRTAIERVRNAVRGCVRSVSCSRNHVDVIDLTN